MDKHLILEFMECSISEEIDLSVLEYDYVRNLNVFRGSDIPAVNFDQQGTLTQTKAPEGSDSDYDSKYNRILLATATQTRAYNETADDDPGIKLSILMATSTRTFTNTETSDSDRDKPYHNVYC
jgi:hypothetical protein